jgi:hypothetical protein
MLTWNRHVAVAALFGASLLTPLAAHSAKVKIVSGLVGGQDDVSRKLSALSPAAANSAATHDLLSVLRPAGKFTLDNSRNVEGMIFVTPPYQTGFRDLCREDRVTLRYTYESKFDAAGTWLKTDRQPAGVEAQPLYHVAQLPVPGFVPGTSYPATVCDVRHPDAGAAWFEAPTDTDAVRAANLFRMAEDEVKAGRLTPGPCDPHGVDSCAQWLMALDDPSKIVSVAPCTANTGGDVCYVISFDSVDVTVAGTLSRDDMDRITPAAITSVRVETVMTVSD